MDPTPFLYCAPRLKSRETLPSYRLSNMAWAICLCYLIVVVKTVFWHRNIVYQVLLHALYMVYKKQGGTPCGNLGYSL